MIAVLLSSERKGGSSWVNVRDRKRICFRGLSGDTLRLHCRSGELVEIFDVIEDCDLAILPGVAQVRVEHVEASGSSIFVDLR